MSAGDTHRTLIRARSRAWKRGEARNFARPEYRVSAAAASLVSSYEQVVAQSESDESRSEAARARGR